MKHFKTLVIAVVLAVGSISFASAQSKVAHIDVQQLMKDMPAMKTAQAELQKLSENYQNDIKTSYQELQTKMSLYQNEAATKSQDENQKRAAEVDGMQKTIMQAQQQAQKELQEKELELLQPIMQKANDAIQKVGKEKGFQYVLDASPGSGVILAEGTDIMADVKKELGF
ncbi:OmpH family outer membrane protein [Galbibacter orientalis]|uniref:Outer membrane protein n=1 Tax=Galbibacter orientalis DSM 19592 TaxID=926559 RepID=I3C5F0_9FLAO|nr:OmpH family outer membrane protein [Galbibacter orientalis]EIJ38843.1 outer membrane protein [Galbibacter orientalis DSM 19592]